jgi:hypothetical protein
VASGRRRGEQEGASSRTSAASGRWRREQEGAGSRTSAASGRRRGEQEGRAAGRAQPPGGGAASRRGGQPDERGLRAVAQVAGWARPLDGDEHVAGGGRRELGGEESGGGLVSVMYGDKPASPFFLPICCHRVLYRVNGCRCLIYNRF